MQAYYMVEVRPFKGFLYDPEKIGDYSCVVAPPYDVIPGEKRDELYRKSDHGIIRLILGKERETDSDSENKYTRAKQDLNNWVEQGIIKKDDKDSLYIYAQRFEADGKIYERTGFIGLMKIQDPGEDSVLPHEYTLAKPKQDRMNLIAQVRSNLSPIFMLFNDAGNKVKEVLKDTMEKEKPLIDIEIDGVTHKLWRLSEDSKIDAITRELKDGKTIIADGHHRFEVARRYRESRKNDPDYDGTAEYVMVYFTDMSRPEALKVFPTHRVVKKLFLKKEDALRRLREYFIFETVENMDILRQKLEEKSDTPHVFGLCLKGEFFLMVPENPDILRGLITEEKSDHWKKLDVSVLQYGVFEKILSMDCFEGNITYVKTFDEALKLIEDNTHEAAFLLNATRVDQLKDVAELGEMMPQKSTYFYPKLLSGLVINKLDSRMVDDHMKTSCEGKEK